MTTVSCYFISLLVFVFDAFVLEGADFVEFTSTRTAFVIGLVDTYTLLAVDSVVG